MVNGHVDNAVSGIDYGAGIRIFNGTNAVYVYTNDLSEDNLIKTAEQAAEASVGKSVVQFPQKLNKNYAVGQKRKRKKRYFERSL